jgi:hypothetical protein
VSTYSTDAPFRMPTVNQSVVQSLVIPLAMIMGDKLHDSPSMTALAERNQAVQTLLFDRADEPPTSRSPARVYITARTRAHRSLSALHWNTSRESASLALPLWWARNAATRRRVPLGRTVGSADALPRTQPRERHGEGVALTRPRRGNTSDLVELRERSLDDRDKTVPKIFPGRMASGANQDYIAHSACHVFRRFPCLERSDSLSWWDSS